MTDIVERLRASSEHSQRCGWFTHARLDWQAADEIERLHADKAELIKKRNADEMQKMIDYWGQRAEKAEAEIARLRAALREAARRLIANGDGFGANEVTRALGAKSVQNDERKG